MADQLTDHGCSGVSDLWSVDCSACVGGVPTFSACYSSSHLTTRAFRRKGVLPRRLRPTHGLKATVIPGDCVVVCVVTQASLPVSGRLGWYRSGTRAR